MNYPTELYRLAQQKLDARRQRALLQWEQDRAKLPELYPEVAAQQNVLRDTNMNMVLESVNYRNDLTAVKALVQRELEILNDLIYKLGVPERYLGPQFTCKDCWDAGTVNGKTCKCQEAILKDLAYTQLSDRAAVQNSSFAAFAVDNYPAGDRDRMVRVLRSCQRYAEQFKGVGGQNLMFWGGTGLGKTHLSLAIADKVVSSGYLVLYASAPHLMGEMESEQFGQNAAATDYRRMVFDCDLLIIDDLGAEFSTRFTTTAIYDIINTRLTQRKPMIINTNLDMKSLRSRYDERIASRLQGQFEQVRFSGPDIRLKKFT
ncbi:MAG: ATP-binding protein [Candidatus Fimivivens sp.]